MRIDEINDDSSLVGTPGSYDPGSDEVTRADLLATRKNTLTLKDLNRLKKLRAFRTLQNLRRQDTLSVIYGQSGSEDDGGF